VLKKEGLKVAKDLKEVADAGASFCVVATDSKEHARHILEAELLKMAVLSEKPLCTQFPEAWALSQKCTDVKKIFVGCVLRFSESLQFFKKSLSNIGRIYSVRIECQSYLPDWRPDRDYKKSYSAKNGEGGVLLDLIHEIDYASWIFGWPSAVSGDLRNFGILGIDSEEMADLHWENDQGVFISLSLDYLSRIPRRKIRALGQNGVLEWDGLKDLVCLEIAGKAAEITRFSQTRDDMFLKQAKAFLNFEGTSMEEGMKALAICDAARLSSATGQKQTVLYSL